MFNVAPVASVLTKAFSISTSSGAGSATVSVASEGESLANLPQPLKVGAGSAAPAGPAMATADASAAAVSNTMYLMSALTQRGRRTCVLGHPLADQAAEMPEEALVLVRRVGRLHGLDEQPVELGRSDEVVDELVEVRQVGRAELAIAVGLEVLVGELAVLGELVLVAQVGPVADLE